MQDMVSTGIQRNATSFMLEEVNKFRMLKISGLMKQQQVKNLESGFNCKFLGIRECDARRESSP